MTIQRTAALPRMAMTIMAKKMRFHSMAREGFMAAASGRGQGTLWSKQSWGPGLGNYVSIYLSASISSSASWA